MTGRDFYNEFKDALDYLGVGFTGMEDANVVLDGNKLTMFVVGGRQCCLEIPTHKVQNNGEMV